MGLARHEFAELIARAFDGAIMVDGHRVVAHKSGIHVVRGGEHVKPPATKKPLDRENDWSDL